MASESDHRGSGSPGGALPVRAPEPPHSCWSECPWTGANSSTPDRRRLERGSTPRAVPPTKDATHASSWTAPELDGRPFGPCREGRKVEGFASHAWDGPLWAGGLAASKTVAPEVLPSWARRSRTQETGIPDAANTSELLQPSGSNAPSATSDRRCSLKSARRSPHCSICRQSVAPSPVALYGHSHGGFCGFGGATLTSNVERLVLYEGWPVPDPTVFALPAEVANGRTPGRR